ncbi:hypothetical protein GPJ56_007390 [Histomonas meleagridis]|uniref:uncharacterized protein n=1 Tax=Histomonas meleagridis TaxID=135588 RepID=UPI00355A8257|nr:hypothetical protein GPJ56_007390 [Histomonas meleagridis]KAH0804236.1 hypothetical protein GO595_003066 [Histomonas meleagridis]
MEESKPTELFGCGEYAIHQPKSGPPSLYKFVNQKIQNVDINFPENLHIEKIIETSNDESGLPGFALMSESNSYFLSFYSMSFEEIPSYNDLSKVAIFDQFQQIEIRGDELIHIQLDTKICNVPPDSIIICSNPSRALLISKAIPFSLIITPKKTINFPQGFSIKMECATFFDDNSVAFSTNDGYVHLYSLNSEIKSVKVGFSIIRIDYANLDCFEQMFVCLSADHQLFGIHFLSSTITKLSENILDFCIIHSPFDQIVIENTNSEISLLNVNEIEPINQTIHSIINALDSRVLTGISQLSDQRSRLALRKNLIDGKNQIFPPMITLFGSPPEEEKDESEDSQQLFWVENAEGLSFDICCNNQFPHPLDVFLSSKSCSFICSCMILPIDEQRIHVVCQIVLESMKQVDSFQVFLKFDEQVSYVDSVCFSIQDLVNQKFIERINESYFVSFPNELGVIQYPPNSEIIDNGIIVHIVSDNCRNFEKESMSIKYSLPEDSKFVKNQNLQKVLSAAKEIIRQIEQFIQVILFDGNQEIDAKYIKIQRASIEELFSSIIW